MYRRTGNYFLNNANTSFPKFHISEENQNKPKLKTLEEVEREHILTVMNQFNFKITGSGGASEISGIPATTLHSKIKKLGIRKSYE